MLLWHFYWCFKSFC